MFNSSRWPTVRFDNKIDGQTLNASHAPQCANRQRKTARITTERRKEHFFPSSKKKPVTKQTIFFCKRALVVINKLTPHMSFKTSTLAVMLTNIAYFEWPKHIRISQFITSVALVRCPKKSFSEF